MSSNQQSDNFIAFSTDTQGSHQQHNPHKYRPYNNSWRQNNRNSNHLGEFNPTGFSSPIRHQNQNYFRGGGKNFNNRGFGHRSFQKHSGHQHQFRKSNYQQQPPHLRGADSILEYYHPSMIEDPWQHFNLESDKQSATNVEENTNSTSDRDAAESSDSDNADAL